MTPSPAGKQKLAEIVAGLDGVTPGPWLPIYTGDAAGSMWEVRQKDTDPTNKHHWPARVAASVVGIRYTDNHPNADHFARCDPASIRSILDYVQMVEQERDTAQASTDAAIADYNALKAENERLAKALEDILPMAEDLWANPDEISEIRDARAAMKGVRDDG